MEKELLENLLNESKTLSQIAKITGKGQTTVRYWINKYQLEKIKNTHCEVCQTLLTGNQRNYCSVKCRMKTTNFKHQVYTCQQARGLERKKQLIEIAGGECCDCGYKKNISALEFHHLNPEEKSFGIDLRKCSCAKWDRLVEEVKKCVLICANCHRERHHPDLIL
jgi:transposase-like protein